MNNKKIMDERQEIINKNMLIRSFGVLSILLIMSIILLSFINISQVAYQLMLIAILTLTSIYMWIDAFISRILYYDVKNNKDIKTKILACVITLLGVNISLLIIYYIILKLWTMWYR